MLNVFFDCRVNGINLLEMNIIAHDAQWLYINRVLCNEGLLVGSSTKADAPLSTIDPYFGPKTNKNGWEYEEYVELAAAAQIKA